MIKTLENQMVQERTRRSDLIIADAQREAMRLESEGTKIVLQNRGIGEQEVLKKLSEGVAQSQILQAEAEAESLKKMKDQLAQDGVNYVDYIATEKYSKAIYAGAGKRSLTIPFIKPGINGLFGDVYKKSGAVKGGKKFGDLD